MNRGVAERAVHRPPLLNLRVRTMASREQTLPVSRALFSAVCRVRQLQSAARRVNGSQSDKRRAVTLYRVCFHTRSQTVGRIDCSCLTAQQTDRPAAVAEITARPGPSSPWSPGAATTPPRSIVLSIQQSVCCSLTELLVWVHRDKV